MRSCTKQKRLGEEKQTPIKKKLLPGQELENPY